LKKEERSQAEVNTMCIHTLLYLIESFGLDVPHLYDTTLVKIDDSKSPNGDLFLHKEIVEAFKKKVTSLEKKCEILEEEIGELQSWI
jgi:hypothetical protein